MKFSIIIPIYNVQEYLDECINSVLDQTLTDFELILIDDGSQDESSKICEEYAKKDSRVKVLHLVNGGAARARNKGIEISCGEKLCFLDSDDYWMNKDALLKIDSEFKNTSADIVQFAYKRLPQGEMRLASMNDCSDTDSNRVIKKLVTEKNLSVAAWCISISRLYLIEHNLFFPEGYRCEDIYWAICTYITLPKFGFVNEFLYTHRVERKGSVTSGVNERHLDEYLKILLMTINKIETVNIEAKDALLSYFIYQILIFISYINTIDFKYTDKRRFVEFAKKYCKKYLGFYNDDPRVALAGRVYKLFGYRILSILLTTYLKKTRG